MARNRRLPVAPPTVLPPLYARWMAELLQGPLPRETEATCDDCAMLPHEGDEDDGAEYFDPLTKCCSFLPVLPNFLVGAILAHGDGPGRRSIEARIDARLGVRPLGLDVTPAHRAIYEHVGSRAFGRTRSLRCPHVLDAGGCGIWLHRNSVCATWYCKHVRGGVGAELWRNGIERLLLAVEAALARHCLAELGIAPRAVLAMLPRSTEQRRNELIDEVDEATYAAMWGSFRGAERDLFLRCARVVEKLSWREVLAVAGPDVRLLAAATKDLYRAARSRAIPARLAIGKFRVLGATEEGVRVDGYSAYDPIDVPAELFRVLYRFDGRPTREVRAQLEAEDGIALDDAFLRMLVDFDVLVDATDRN